jgi:7,8-dihydropterin-6-yl-methyl-4-(beta-D-ribofuranosyl)aminobenzene 5'-phosphate synthase
MKLVTLMENTACSPELHAAHGLSLYLETPRHRILFDMGPDASFLDNARALGVDVAAVDVAVLSHGHSDHGGGLRAFLACNSRAKVYLHAGAFGAYYALVPGREPRYIGLDGTLREFASRFTVTDGALRLDEELTLFDGVEDVFAGMDASAKLRERQEDGTFRADPFRHEQDLLITAEGKSVVVAGCAHRGIVNIRRRAAELLGREPDVMVGGFHLFELEPGAPASEELLGRTGRALAQGQTVYYTGHCTGEYAFEELKTALGGRLRRITAGGVCTL